MAELTGVGNYAVVLLRRRERNSAEADGEEKERGQRTQVLHNTLGREAFFITADIHHRQNEQKSECNAKYGLHSEKGLCMVQVDSSCRLKLQASGHRQGFTA